MSNAQFGRHTTRRVAVRSGLLLVALLMAMALSGGRWGRATAQEGTPDAASPVAATCTPAVGDGAMEQGMGDMASPEASPVATETPAGTEADAETAAAVVAAAENVAACYNNGEVEAFLGLVTDHFVQEVLGEESKETAAQNLSGEDGIQPLTGLEIDAESVLTYDDGRASVDASYWQSQYQFVEARWFFVQSGSDWLIDDEVLLSPEPDVDFVTIVSASVGAEEGATVGFDQSTAVTQTEAVILHLTNNSAETREFVVLLLPEGTTLNEDGTLPEGMADAEALFTSEDSTFVAYAEVPGGGGIVDVALVGLPAGVYVLVDATDGTVVPLTVNPPAA